MSKETSDLVLIEERFDGRIVLLTLNRPDASNAIDDAMALAIEAAVAHIKAAPRIEAVLLTGAGRVFCSGGDVGVFSASSAR